MGEKEDKWIKWNCRIRNVTVTVKASCNNFLWVCWGSVVLPLDLTPCWKLTNHLLIKTIHSIVRVTRLHIIFLKTLFQSSHHTHKLLICFNHCCVSYVKLRSKHLYTEEASLTPFWMNSLPNFLYVSFHGTLYYIQYMNRSIHILQTQNLCWKHKNNMNSLYMHNNVVSILLSFICKIKIRRDIKKFLSHSFSTQSHQRYLKLSFGKQWNDYRGKNHANPFGQCWSHEWY